MATEASTIIACPSCGTKNRVRAGVIGTPRCSVCHTDLPWIVETRADTFDDELRSSLPVLVDFWAPWCGPCRMVAPELATVAGRNAGRYLVLKVNTDALPDVSERFQIRSIPTMAVFVSGREAGRTTGARPAADIEGFIQSTLARR